MKKPSLPHLSKSKDLETTYEAIRAGFVALALEKNRRATPHVERARALKISASKAKTPAGLLQIKAIQPALLTAAGVSDKATNHLEAADKREAIKGLIRNFLEPAGINFVEELVYRFLLTRGDTLGGSMRNVGGFLAQCKLSRSIIAHLANAGIRYHWLHAGSATWAMQSDNDADIELQMRGLAWKANGQPRTLIYNLTVPLVRNNVDMCLFNCAPESSCKETHKLGSAYLALGELKGGIDPAGADEHWKTASTALSRIRKAFATKRLRPKTFFVGAAIETKMAAEIWAMLQAGELDNAANLTSETQLASLTAWLCTL